MSSSVGLTAAASGCALISTHCGHVASKSLVFSTSTSNNGGYSINNHHRSQSSSLSFPVFTGLQKGCVHSNISSSFNTAVAAIDSNQIIPAEKEQATKYHFLVANAKFMLDEEEHFQEQLYERLHLYEERKKEQDFWLVIEPKFLDKFPTISKRLRRPAVALVSTNGPWITFMKLRLDRVLAESFDADSLEDALASNPTTIKFEKPEKWVAPYPKYEYGWWEAFLPKELNKSEV